MNKTINTSTLPEFFNNCGNEFDRMFKSIDGWMPSNTGIPAYPPFNVIQTDTNNYVIEFAVAGLALANLEITHKYNKLTVQGKKVADNDTTYLRRGISSRAFKQEFILADHVTVETAEIDNGILSIKLHREIPESMQPRQIKINKIDK